MLHKSGIVKAIKVAHKTGYEYVPENEEITIVAKTWALQCRAGDIPVDGALEIVSNAGQIPCAPTLIQAGAANQMMIADTVLTRLEHLGGVKNGVAMEKVPLVFKDR